MSASAETLPGLAFPILIGDIGGTNARFALLMDETSAPVVFPVVPTGGYPSIQAALETDVLPQAARRPRSAIIAVAAPVKGDEIPLTNAGWVITPADMIATLGLSDVIVLNDFEAQALAVAAIAKTDCAQIGAGKPLESASCAVLGPGTGLGVAGLLHTHATYFPVPGEGGHVDIGPRTPRDTAIWPHLETIEGRISAEQLLCGRGIVNIYQAICRTDGLTPEHTDPAEITAAGLGHTDPGHTGKACVETLSLFAGYLGRVAGDMALIFMARGGVYLAGGISQKILPALQQPEFRAAFEDKAPHSALMRSIPTYVVTHPFAALAGLAAFAQTPARFGVATEGRHWKA